MSRGKIAVNRYELKSVFLAVCSYPNILSVNICAASYSFLWVVAKCFPNAMSLDADWDGDRLSLGETSKYENANKRKR